MDHGRTLPLLSILLALGLPATALGQTKTSPLQGENAELGIRGGPDFVWERVQVKHQPDAVALAKAEADTRLDWRPRITVDYANPGPNKMSLSMQVVLQDVHGTPYLTCEDTATVKAFERHAFTVVCATRPMILRDWPKVTHVKFTGTATPLVGAVDQSYPMARGVAEVRQPVGPLVIEKIIVPNFPTEAEVMAARNNPATKTRIKIVAMVSNTSSDRVRFKITATLIDRTGAVIASCDERNNVRGGVKMDDVTVCSRTDMRTAEWANVVAARVTASIL
ncbi:MAG: hypothetical protein QM765_36225 [Myxococcales bacterium]